MKMTFIANVFSSSAQHAHCRETKVDKAFRIPFMIYLFFGYNYLDSVFLDSRILCVIVNLYCLFAVSTSSWIVVYNYIQAPLTPYMFIVIEYVITTFMSSFDNRGYRVFFSNMESIDSRQKVADDYYTKITNTHYVYALAIAVLRVIYTGIVCVMFFDFCSVSPLEVTMINYIVIAVELNAMPRVIMLSFIRHRMNLLQRQIEHLPPGISTVDKGVDINCTNHYLSYLDIYRELLDNVDLVAGIVNPKYAINIMCCLPKIMILVYKLLLDTYDGISLVYVLLMAFECVQWGVLTCLPGFVNEQIIAGTEKIKIALIHQRLDSKNERTRAQISEFLAYMEARPFKHTVWRVIRVDVSLPVGLLSLCTTYLIIMIQFSHLLE